MSVEYMKNSDGTLTPFVNGEAAPFVVHPKDEGAVLETIATDHVMEPKHFTKPSALSAFVEAATKHINSKKAK